MNVFFQSTISVLRCW